VLFVTTIPYTFSHEGQGFRGEFGLFNGPRPLRVIERYATTRQGLCFVTTRQRGGGEHQIASYATAGEKNGSEVDVYVLTSSRLAMGKREGHCGLGNLQLPSSNGRLDHTSTRRKHLPPQGHYLHALLFCSWLRLSMHKTSQSYGFVRSFYTHTSSGYVNPKRGWGGYPCCLLLQIVDRWRRRNV
jgi:hypothetical protein